MDDFNSIIGQDVIIEHMSNAIEMNKVSHAYIIEGEPYSGKKTLAKIFAKTIQCEVKKNDCCNKCKCCIQIENDNHPDVIWVRHESSANIRVDDIRTQINNDIAMKPFSSNYKIYIIDEAEKLNTQAQNALLKTIEEPPAYVIIILLTTNIGVLLSTILSRCVILHTKPIQDYKMKDYLINILNITERKADFCIGFALGNLGKAIHLSSSDRFNEMQEECIHVLKYIKEMNMYEIIDALRVFSKNKLDIYDYLDFMMMWYRDILMLKVTGNPNKLIYKDEYKYLSGQSSTISYEGIDNILQALDKAKIRLKSNVNFDVVMELLLFTIKDFQ